MPRENSNHRHRISKGKAPSRAASCGDCDALLNASASGDVAEFQRLLKVLKINSVNAAGETPLSMAAAWDQLQAARMLLRAGADPNIADRTGGTPLMLAAQHGSLKMIRELVRHGADINAVDRAGNSVLMHALWRNDRSEIPDAIRELLRGDSARKKTI